LPGRGTFYFALTLDLHAAPDGTLLPVAVTGAGITAMELAMSGAAEIAQRVESRSRVRNYSLQFTSEDIRAIGLTMFIQAMRERGVTWDQR
jgi:multisubunit Na+/H+ antiporter MnhB subunit